VRKRILNIKKTEKPKQDRYKGRDLPIHRHHLDRSLRRNDLSIINNLTNSARNINIDPCILLCNPLRS
jgi:hypothetical protein